VLERFAELIEELREPDNRARLAQQGQRLLRGDRVFGKRIIKWLTSHPEQPEHWDFSEFDLEALNKAKLEKLRDLSTHPEFARLIELGQLQALLPRVLFARALEDAHQWCSAELQRRSAAREAQGYSAQIAHLHQALSGTAGAELAARLRLAYPHALIDEFQDTDQQQFDIFERIYALEHAASTSLHLIGDPKQSIYGFRGGDLAAYLRAARGISSRWSIRTNWRSTHAVVTALNGLYGLSQQGGFAHQQIRYEPVQCGHRLAQKPWTEQGVEVPIGLRIWVDPAVASSSMTQQEEPVLIACADRITELLSSGQWQLDGRPLRPADITVLAHRHQPLKRMRELLIQRGVPCASTGRLRLADAPVAVELQLILEAVVAHDDDGALRGALSTPLLGFDLAQLDQLALNETAWLRQVQRFVHWRAILQRRGVLALIEDLLLERAATELQHADGERRLTDLRHLGEWLEAQHAGAGAAPAQILSTLRRLREDGTDDTDAQQLRTETDAHRVQLLTIFAAKGLQFPVVFLPVLWRASGRDADQVHRYHADDQSLRLDAGSARFEAHAELARAETEAEELRTLYVALTRAMYVSEVYCSERKWPPKDRKTGLELLLLDISEDARPHGALAHIAKLPAVEVLTMPDPVTPMPRYRAEHGSASAGSRQSRSDFPEPRAAYLLHSFSSLTHSASVTAETLIAAAADESGPLPVQVPPPAADLLHALPDPRLLALAGQRGMAFGNASHAVLERATDAALWPAQSELLLKCLREQGFAVDLEHPDSAWVKPWARRLDEVRQADLGGGLRLLTLKPEQQVREFEFHFPLQGVAVQRLRQICARHGQPQLLPPWLEHGRLKGLMTGFIDLVYQHRGRFGVLDYKSNWLGDTLSHYQPAALAHAMQAEFYPLQALIYSIALHRYLHLRLPGYHYDRHHAGALYVYVRAAGLEASGVCALRFTHELVDEFNQALG
jgi:exodeoxyribonuclease V beta subunit